MRDLSTHDDDAHDDAPDDLAPEFGEAHCRECNFTFQFNAAFYRARGLSLPRRCPRCRAFRRSNKPPAVRVVGRVDDVREDHAFLVSDHGRRYFAHQSNVVPHDWPLAVGARVSFEPAIDPGDYRRTNRSPRAFVVRVVVER